MAEDTKAQGLEAQKDITKWASAKDGEFRRLASTFRNHIEDGGTHPPVKGRYHLYVSLACPWAHRTLIVRKLKGLEDFIDVSVVHPHMGALGWSFFPPIRGENGEYPATKGEVGKDDGIADVTGDQVYGSKFIRELYFRAEKEYSGRFTVPVLWDKQLDTIVNNESAEIIRMFNTEFNSVLPAEFVKIDLYPSHLQKEIEAQHAWVYDTVNNGVYKSGFASTQKAYQHNVVTLFESLDKLEKLLEEKKKAGTGDWVVGDQMTEADVRLFTTIIRFDNVYVLHFKCNIGTIRSNYPNLNRWMKNLYYNFPAYKDTTNIEHIKAHYFTSHPQINPFRVVPVGPLPAIEPL
ncbi:glutathione-S-transferase [Meredithblackwellia eburnea MCA 4105]